MSKVFTMKTPLKEITIKPDRNTLKPTLCSVGTESELINKGGRMNECVNLAKRNDSTSNCVDFKPSSCSVCLMEKRMKGI